MMDKTVRLDALKQLDAGTITITQAIERHGGSERHWRRLLSTYRKPRAGSGATPDPVTIKPGETAQGVMGGVRVAITNKGPEPVHTQGTAPIPPTMSDIDKVLAGGGAAAEQKGPDPVLTADMALQGIRMAKMLAVVSAAEMMGVVFKSEQEVQRLCSLQPVTETIIRMQKPEAWAKLGELGSDPKALIGVLIMDTVVAGVALWRMMPRKVEDKKDE
jgi:hypothetical protein